MRQGSITVGDIEVHHRRVGDTDGPSWVLVHGIGEDGSSWGRVQELLEPHVTSYAVDVRGHGATPLGDADGSLAQLTDDLRGVLEAVGPSVLVGFSMGGSIALSAAARTPLVQRVVGIGTSSVVGRRAAESFRADATAIDATGGPAAREAAARFLGGVQDPPPDWEDERGARLEALGDGAGFANAARAMASLAESPLTPVLPDITVPVDLLVGELDRVCPMKAARMIVDAVPDGRARELPGVGHFAAVEDAAGLARALLDVTGTVHDR